MEAMVLERHGGPEVLQRKTITIDEPGARCVRVRIRAVAMNHMDLWVRRGLPNVKHEYPHRLGCDIVGEVEALGADARRVGVGDRVMIQPGVSCGVCSACVRGQDNLCRQYRILGENTQGGYAQYINVPDANLLPLPDGINFIDAAALPLCTLTAWQAIYRKAKVRPEHTVLIQAAGSGVSSIAIQLCKLVGAKVITTVGSREKVDPARALGADEVILYREQDLATECRRITERRGVDVIFDHVGGEVFEKSIRAVGWGGKIVTVGATAGFSPKIDLRHVFFRQIEILGSTMGSKGDLAAAMPLIADGRIRPVVGQVFPLWEAGEAHKALEARSVFGKVVLEVPQAG
ncbi:MAG: alcohol dehydrogenase [Sorangium cellulosum]|nr:MAG: alcohol dehydrogenase [Sorangium cellulosum]